MKAELNKLEILSNQCARYGVSFSGVESNAIVAAMEEYATTPKAVTDGEIEKLFSKYTFSPFKSMTVKGFKAAITQLMREQQGEGIEEEYEAIHKWFELSYAQYLTIPRSVLQSMPNEWQTRMAKCLDELDESIDWRPKEGRYWVKLKDDKGRYTHDPLMDYQRGRRVIPKITDKQ